MEIVSLLYNVAYDSAELITDRWDFTPSVAASVSVMAP